MPLPAGPPGLGANVPETGLLLRGSPELRREPTPPGKRRRLGGGHGTDHRNRDRGTARVDDVGGAPGGRAEVHQRAAGGRLEAQRRGRRVRVEPRAGPRRDALRRRRGRDMDRDQPRQRRQRRAGPPGADLAQGPFRG